MELDPALRQTLERLALPEGRTVEEVVVEILRQASGDAETRREARRRALEGLAGTWTKEQADAFDRELALMRKIDPEEWQ